MKKAIYSIQGGALREWLKQRRLDAEVTMRELGDELGVSFQTIHKIESGERRLDVVEYVTYCEVLGIDPCEGIDLVRVDG